VSGPGQNRRESEVARSGHDDARLRACVSSADVRDERVVPRPPLRVVDARHGVGIERERCEAVHGLGGNRDEPAREQHPGGLGDGGRIGADGVYDEDTGHILVITLPGRVGAGSYAKRQPGPPGRPLTVARGNP
jgi:hypothetical protein